jgi:hypothetical protein
MHGKNVENFQGTDNFNFKLIGISSKEYYKKYAKYKKFGFEILFDEKDPLNKSKKYDNEINLDVKVLINVTSDNYTDDTKICRSILNYWIKVKNPEFFRSRDLIEKWLLTNCTYFEDKYSGDTSKTNILNKIEPNNADVVFLLERLKYLTLLDARFVESKNHEITTEYRFTELGKLVAMIIKSAEDLKNYSCKRDI